MTHLKKICLLLAFALSPAAYAQETDMSLALRAGYTNISNASPAADGIGFGFDSSFAAFGNFSLGGTYYRFSSNDSQTIGTVVNDIKRSFNVLAVAPAYGITKGAMQASVGALGGVMLASSKVKTRNINNETSGSGTAGVVGFFINGNVAIAGPAFFQIKGEYLKSLGDTKAGMLTASGGIGFYL